MFAVEQHGRDSYDHAGSSRQGCQSRRWFTFGNGRPDLRIIAHHGFKLADASFAQLDTAHRAERRYSADLLLDVERARHA
jgi:hypothetical protein